MKLKNKKAFTLVELIVVITILIILGTIAFISLEGYSKNSRDGVRVADVNSARKSLELFITEKGFYPIPDNPTNIIYSGGTAWTQGTIGDGVIRNLDKIDKKIVDPLTENEYTYSITSSKTEYQIGAITEGGTIGYKLPINQTYAAEKKATAMVKGTYNERFLRVQSGTLNWILAIPSIITTDLTQTDVQNILTSNKLVYNNYQNIPYSYNNAGYAMTGGFNYTNSNPLIYSGSLKNLTESNTGKLDFITNLKAAYEGTILQGEANYQDIVNADPSNQTGSIYLVNRFINTNLGGIKVSNIILPTTGGTTTETSSNSVISPTNLSLIHSSRSKTFTFSWTAGENNGGSCKLQYYKNGTTWTDISATTYNCDTTLSNQSVTLPGDGWNSIWSSIPVRIIRTSDSEVLGTFGQTLTCSNITGSSTSTPNIDEDCNGEWDNISGAGTWVLDSNNTTYYYGPNLRPNTPTCSTDLNTCTTWANTNGYNYVSLVSQETYSLYCCYANNTGVKSNYTFNSAQHYVRTSGLYN